MNMPDIIVAGKSYRTTREAAELWGLNIKTIRKYANPQNGIIPGCIKKDDRLLIPCDAIRPITQPVAQELLWAIVFIKNEPDRYLDLSQFGISNLQLHAVLDEMERKLYIESPHEYASERSRLVDCRITNKGFGLIRYRKQFKNSRFEGKLTAENITLAFTAAQTIMQLVQLGASCL